uniref:Uncharacterized protein n=1 Tax=Trichogramma kaykai TaxID=54128 RepID=A0ABD2WVR6_9HYME
MPLFWQLEYFLECIYGYSYGYPDWFNENLIVDSRRLGAEVFYKNVDECAYRKDDKVHADDETRHVLRRVSGRGPSRRRDGAGIPAPGEYRFHEHQQADLSFSFGPRLDQERY